MADDDNLSGLPKFEQYRDPARPEEPDPPPKLYPSLLKWALAGAVVGGFIGYVPDVLSLLSRKVPLGEAVGSALIPALPWALGGAVLGALIGGLIDEFSRRRKD